MIFVGRFSRSLLFIVLLFPVSSSGQVNNSIFNGSSNDGHDKSNYIQSANHLIFNGSVNDGHDLTHYIQASNSNIFAGGFNDGHEIASYSQSANSNIFDGGIADGFVLSGFIQASNGNIFSGGNSDGHDLAISLQESNNGIFAGGNVDGHDLSRYTQSPNSNIFAGGIDDGHTLALSSLENPPCTSIVTSIADSGPGTLRQAIICANIGDTITFDPNLTGQTILLASSITIGKDVWVFVDPNENVSLSAKSIDKALVMNSNFSSYWKGIHIVTGNATVGGGIVNSGTLMLEDINVSLGPNAPVNQIALQNNGVLKIISSLSISK